MDGEASHILHTPTTSQPGASIASTVRTPTLLTRDAVVLSRWWPSPAAHAAQLLTLRITECRVQDTRFLLFAADGGLLVVRAIICRFNPHNSLLPRRRLLLLLLLLLLPLVANRGPVPKPGAQGSMDAEPIADLDGQFAVSAHLLNRPSCCTVMRGTVGAGLPLPSARRVARLVLV